MGSPETIKLIILNYLEGNIQITMKAHSNTLQSKASTVSSLPPGEQVIIEVMDGNATVKSLQAEVINDNVTINALQAEEPLLFPYFSWTVLCVYVGQQATDDTFTKTITQTTIIVLCPLPPLLPLPPLPPLPPSLYIGTPLVIQEVRAGDGVGD